MKNRIERYFVMLVEKGKEESFMRYVNDEPLQIVTWLDTIEALAKVERGVRQV